MPTTLTARSDAVGFADPLAQPVPCATDRVQHEQH
jgi:hypothetical protein